MREIECFWKEGWEYNRTHHTYVEPRVTIPQVWLQRGSEAAVELQRYYDTMEKFISKLKTEHEDETNYRIHLDYYPTEEQEAQLLKAKGKTAQMALEHLLRLFRNVTGEMYVHFEESRKASGDLMMEDLDDTSKASLNFFQVLCSNVL
jgi:hypothetical protein